MTPRVSSSLNVFKKGLMDDISLRIDTRINEYCSRPRENNQQTSERSISLYLNPNTHSTSTHQRKRSNSGTANTFATPFFLSQDTLKSDKNQSTHCEDRVKHPSAPFESFTRPQIIHKTPRALIEVSQQLDMFSQRSSSIEAVMERAMKAVAKAPMQWVGSGRKTNK